MPPLSIRGRRPSRLGAIAIAVLAGALVVAAVAALRQGRGAEPAPSAIAVELAALRATEDGVLGSAAALGGGRYRIPVRVAMEALVARPDLLDSAFAPQQVAADPLIAQGQMLFTTKICFTCHSLDGTPLIGPTLKDLLGMRREMSDGRTITVDEAYIRESITDPLRQTAKGFVPGTMPPVVGGVTEQDVAALLALIRSLSPAAPAP